MIAIQRIRRHFGFGSALVNVAFVALLYLFLTGPPVEPTDDQHLSASLLLAQFHPYFIVFLAICAWRRWADGWQAFSEVAAVRFLRATANLLSRSPSAVYIFTAAGWLIMLTVSVRRHVIFESRRDLALFDHALWNTLHGIFYRSSLIDDLSLFGEHFDPLQLSIVPLYFIAPSPVTLLVVQALIIALGAVPVYWMARQRLAGDIRLWAVFPIAYLMFAPLRAVNRFDYHPGALAVTPFLFALYFMERSRWTIMILFLVMAGLLKENMPAAGVTVGLYLIVAKRRRLLGTIVALSFGLWFYAGITWIIPAFNPRGYGYFHNYAGMGDSISGILASVVLAPGSFITALLTRAGWKLNYILGLFGPLGFLPFLSPEGLFLGLPFLAQHLLATTLPQVSLQTHNVAEVVAFVFFGAIIGAGRFLAWAPRAARLGAWAHARVSTLLAIVLWSATFLFAGWSEVSYLRGYPSTVRAETLRAALQLIPPDASVAAPDRVLPHLTHRRHLYHFPPPQFWFSNPDASASRGAAFVIVDETFLKPGRRAAHDAAMKEVREGSYRSIFERDGIGVWQLTRE